MAQMQDAGAAPQRVPLVILYAETRGFTRTSEILEPSVVLARTAEFFALATAAVERHAGAVRSIFNDTLVAAFAGAGIAMRAVRAAQDIQREFGALVEAWERDYGVRAAVAMGLHHGDAVVGVAGNLKPEQLLVIGDSVSVTARLLHRARAGEYLLSKSVMDALMADRFALDAEELPALELPHRNPIPVFGVLLDTRLDFT